MAASQARTRPGQQARPNDFTGRKREALNREHSDEIKAREDEISTLAAAQQRSIDEDVIDPETREIIKLDGTVEPMDEEEDEAPRLIGSGDKKIEELPEPKQHVPEHVLAGRQQSVEYLEEKVVVRVNCDLEDVTLGYGNTYTFLAGRRYRVPRWIADHLEERGLTW